MDRKSWNRIGLVAAVLLVPGGFLLGGALAARRLRGGTTADVPAREERAEVAAPDDDQR